MRFALQNSCYVDYWALFGRGGMSDVSPYRAPKQKLLEPLVVTAFSGP